MEAILRDLSSYGITEWAEETWKSNLRKCSILYDGPIREFYDMSVNDRYGRTVGLIYADQWSVTTDYGTVDSDVELPNELKPNRKHIIKQSKLYPHKTQPVLHRCHAI